MRNDERLSPWRSVTDSLPKSGADVIAGYRDTAGWRSVRAVYAAARSVVCTCEVDGDCLCEMDDTGESWWPEGWYEIADNADGVNTWRIRGTVTHWMPLPTAPGALEEGTGESLIAGLDNGPDEVDGPWAEGWEERSGEGVDRSGVPY